MTANHDLHELFDREVSPAAAQAIVRAIGTAYRASDECCMQEYDERVHHQAWGYHRWLKIDSELLAVGRRFGGVSRFESNTDQTHIGHTELHFGPLVLTAASVPTRGKIPKPARYRTILAESNQFPLFEQRLKHHAKHRKVWGVILHVPNIASRAPLHIHVGFIAHDNTFACELIDLVARVEAIEAPTVEVAPSLRMRPVAKAD